MSTPKNVVMRESGEWREGSLQGCQLVINVATIRAYLKVH